MSNIRVNNFREKLEQAINQPLNVILEGENGVGKEYFAKQIHEKRTWANNFIIFDWECEHSCQFSILEDLSKNHLREILDVTSKRRNAYFFRRIDLLNSKIQYEIFELLESQAKRGGLSRSQLHQLGLIASLEKKNSNGKKQIDLTLNPFLELFPFRIKIPPLRQRKEEFGSLMHGILDFVNKQQNRKVLGFSAGIFKCFLDYNWPNNIEELISEIERLVTLTKDYELIKEGVLSERMFSGRRMLRTDI